MDRATLAEALDKSCGILTHCAVYLDLSRQHVWRLAKEYDLLGYAKDLRLAEGGSETGRPRDVWNLPGWRGPPA